MISSTSFHPHFENGHRPSNYLHQELPVHSPMTRTNQISNEIGSNTFGYNRNSFVPGRATQSYNPMSTSVYAGQTDTSSIASPESFPYNPASGGLPPGLTSPHCINGPAGVNPQFQAMGPMYDLKHSNGELWPPGYTEASPYLYENAFGQQYPYNRYCGVDFDESLRRKNATRESTNTLKAWLQEHKKNPYPTKGEKIMLAIITKMTLTQVSTWFANARRRLKKENKMTWVPKNRSSDSSNNSKNREDEDNDEMAPQNSDSDDDCDDGDCELPNDELKATSSEQTNEQDLVNDAGAQVQDNASKSSSKQHNVEKTEAPSLIKKLLLKKEPSVAASQCGNFEDSQRNDINNSPCKYNHQPVNFPRCALNSTSPIPSRQNVALGNSTVMPSPSNSVKSHNSQSLGTNHYSISEENAEINLNFDSQTNGPFSTTAQTGVNGNNGWMPQYEINTPFRPVDSGPFHLPNELQSSEQSYYSLNSKNTSQHFYSNANPIQVQNPQSKKFVDKSNLRTSSFMPSCRTSVLPFAYQEHCMQNKLPSQNSFSPQHSLPNCFYDGITPGSVDALFSEPHFQQRYC